MSTFERARKLLGTISGRQEYIDPGEKFENITMVLFQPVAHGLQEPWLKLSDSITGKELTEAEYFETIRQLYNRRNPLAAIGKDVINIEEETAKDAGRESDEDEEDDDSARSAGPQTITQARFGQGTRTRILPSGGFCE